MKLETELGSVKDQFHFKYVKFHELQNEGITLINHKKNTINEGLIVLLSPLGNDKYKELRVNTYEDTTKLTEEMNAMMSKYELYMDDELNEQIIDIYKLFVEELNKVPDILNGIRSTTWIEINKEKFMQDYKDYNQPLNESFKHYLKHHEM